MPSLCESRGGSCITATKPSAVPARRLRFGIFPPSLGVGQWQHPRSLHRGGCAALVASGAVRVMRVLCNN